MEIKPRLLWAITYSDKGHIDPYSIRPLRRQAIEAFCSDPAGPRWPYWQKKGCRPVRVLIAPPTSMEGERGE